MFAQPQPISISAIFSLNSLRRRLLSDVLVKKRMCALREAKEVRVSLTWESKPTNMPEGICDLQGFKPAENRMCFREIAD